MAETADKNISCLIYSVLDNFGFNKENVFLRSNHSEECSTKFNCLSERSQFGFKMVPAGSAAEGLGLKDSDHDCMLVLDDVVCVNQGSYSEPFFVLETDYNNTAPGYTKVVCTNIDRSGEFKVYRLNILNSVTVSRYVSSGLFRHGCCSMCHLSQMNLRQFTVNKPFTTNGPAVTFAVQNGTSPCDIVFSVYFYGSGFLLEWANRKRLHCWPTREVVNKVSEMEGYIVPIGDKQSENQSLEWRICYTTAEKELVSNLSDIQIKVYVVLKLVAKDLLKPICKTITSYVVKNIVFWVAETTHQKHFSADLLVAVLLKSLRFLKYCLENNHFPNYMIPERNLFRGALCGKEKQTFIHFLSECLEDGSVFILRVPKLYHCISYMVTNPENVYHFGKWRDEVEKQTLLINLKKFESYFKTSWNDSGVTNDIQRSFLGNTAEERSMYHLFSLVLPDIVSLNLTGISSREVTELYHSRLNTLNFL